MSAMADDLRLTPQRQAVLDTLAASDDHPTAAQVLERVRARVPGIGPATVYRTLALLVDTGRAGELRAGEGQAIRYDRTATRHDHLVCTGCGRVCDVQVGLDPDALRELNTTTSFTVTGYDIRLHGRCARCAAQDTVKERA